MKMVLLYVSDYGLFTGGSQARKNLFSFGSSGIDKTFVTTSILQEFNFFLLEIYF
jgi:hypothetical protein